MLLKIKKVKGFEDFPIPKFMTEGSVGMDLYAAVSEKVIIPPLGRSQISTGICIEIPRGFEGQVRPRSGLAINHGITLLNTPGTIDSDYRGEVKIVLVNLGETAFRIDRGDRIAQIIFNKIEIPVIEVVEDLEETDRGTKGFGSTGL